MFIIILTSCAADSGKIQKPPDSSENCIVFNDEVIYTVVRSDTSSKTVTDAAVSLRKYIQENINGDIKILTDWIKKTDNVDDVRGEYEILVGLTNRPESIEAYERFKSAYEPLEYLIEKSGNHYVILGNDIMLAEAVEKFIENITIYDGGATLKVTDNLNINLRKPFPVGKLIIDNVNIIDFKIVYPSSYKESEKILIDNIQEYIYLATGFQLDIISDKEKQTEHEIVVGSARNKSYSNHSDLDCIIEIRDGNLYVGGNNYYADAKAVNYLINDFLYYNIYGVNPKEIVLTPSDSKFYEAKPNY